MLRHISERACSAVICCKAKALVQQLVVQQLVVFWLHGES
jgi:hypothetical protein